MFAFHGAKAVQVRQRFEQTCPSSLPVMSENLGTIQVPLIGRYKHVGGVFTPTGGKLKRR